MMNFLNGDPTLLLVGAGGLLIGLVVIFQFLTRPPARQTDQANGKADRDGAHAILILARKPLDDRRSLVSIRYGNNDHLLLLGEEGDLLIHTSPTPLRERHPSAHKAKAGIPMPFPPQPAAKLNTRAAAEYQTTSAIAVPDFLQARAGQPAYAPSPASAHAAAHPVMPQTPIPQAPIPQTPIPQILAPAPAPAPQVFAPVAPPMMPQVGIPASPQAALSETSDVARKLEEAMRQQARAEQPQPVQQIVSAPPSPAAASQYGTTGSEAFEDEIRKLLGRGPHSG